MNDNIDQLHLLAKSLLDYETISGKEMIQVLNGEQIDRGQEKTNENLSEIKNPNETIENETELKPATSTI